MTRVLLALRGVKGPILLVIVLACSGSSMAARPDRAQAAMLALRHYALSACLAQAFPAIRDEARAAQGAYLEFGTHPAQASRLGSRRH